MEFAEYSNLFLQEFCGELPSVMTVVRDWTWSLEYIDLAGGVVGLTKSDGFFGGCARVDWLVLVRCFERVF